MQFYEPGPYEEFVGKLSSISVKPNPKTWEAINSHLDEIALSRKKSIIKRLSFAASILLLVGISLSLFVINDIFLSSDYLSNWESAVTIPYFAQSKTEILTQKDQLEYQLAIAEPIISSSSEELSQPSTINYKPTPTLKPLIKPIALSKLELPHLSEISNSTFRIEKASQISSFNTVLPSDDIEPIIIEEPSSWSLIAYLNPSYSSHTMAALNYKMNPSETGALMWGGEVLVRKEFSNYFAIYSGILVSPTGLDTKDLILLQNNEANKGMESLSANTSFGQVTIDNTIAGISDFSNLASTSSNVLKSSSLNTAEIKQRFYYMEIPLILSTSFTKGLIDVEVKLGCAAGVLIDNKFEVTSTNGRFVGRTENIRPHNASAIGAISLSIPVNNQLNFILEPNIRLNLYPLSYGYETTYPFAASVKFGMGYRF